MSNDKGHRMRYRRAFAEADEQQATIDALVAALELVQKGVPDVLRRECLNQVVEDALALARKGGE